MNFLKRNHSLVTFERKSRRKWYLCLSRHLIRSTSGPSRVSANTWTIETLTTRPYLGRYFFCFTSLTHFGRAWLDIQVFIVGKYFCYFDSITSLGFTPFGSVSCNFHATYSKPESCSSEVTILTSRNSRTLEYNEPHLKIWIGSHSKITLPKCYQKQGFFLHQTFSARYLHKPTNVMVIKQWLFK